MQLLVFIICIPNIFHKMDNQKTEKINFMQMSLAIYYHANELMLYSLSYTDLKDTSLHSATIENWFALCFPIHLLTSP